MLTTSETQDTGSTPEWRVEPYEWKMFYDGSTHKGFVIRAGDQVIASMIRDASAAHKMAAAPDLLIGCRAALVTLKAIVAAAEADGEGEMFENMNWLVSHLGGAIAKATGAES